MDNTLGKSGECRGVMLEFEDCLPQKVCSTACRCAAVDGEKVGHRKRSLKGQFLPSKKN
ncbi:hypothetical protein [Nostoc sp. C052]|uniref:hypothetical protein n=1 Tax=Nostoc sp. C052 TaxID=2576902 RepID=UPI0015C309CE|nr:hypothetical protein [Nostoc sp. C052]